MRIFHSSIDNLENGFSKNVFKLIENENHMLKHYEEKNICTRQLCLAISNIIQIKW